MIKQLFEQFQTYTKSLDNNELLNNKQIAIDLVEYANEIADDMDNDELKDFNKYEKLGAFCYQLSCLLEIADKSDSTVQFIQKMYMNIDNIHKALAVQFQEIHKAK